MFTANPDPTLRTATVDAQQLPPDQRELPPDPAPRRSTRPAERDYDIYRRHNFEFVSQSELAQEYGVTQQRVSQVLRNVERWVVNHPQDEEARCARRGAGDRWETVIGMAMRAFRQSQQEQEVVKERTTLRGHNTEEAEPLVTTTIEKTTRPQHGDVRYLHAAMRAMEKQARLYPNGDTLPRIAVSAGPGVEDVMEATDGPVGEAHVQPAIESLHGPAAEPADVERPMEVTAAESTIDAVAVPERSPEDHASEDAYATGGIALEAAGASTEEDRASEDAYATGGIALEAGAEQPQPVVLLSVGPSPAPPQSAETVSRLDGPHRHGSHRGRRRRRAQRRGRNAPTLDIAPTDRIERTDLSICGPSPEG